MPLDDHVHSSAVDASPVDTSAVARIAALLRGRTAVALTGAGCSTESGIPDYRGAGTRARARNPIQYRAFVSDPAARRRYWARSAVGWARFRRAMPNAAHQALAALQREGALSGIITQNVDGLHQAAGSREVIELHGSLAEVRCLDCHAREGRDALQRRLLALNPNLDARCAPMAPDGDADLDLPPEASFNIPACLVCGGLLKPDVVFFGEGVPAERVQHARARLHAAGALLVVGSSLAVSSGFRFVRWAHAADKPIAIVNLEPTRGDPLATERLRGRAGAVLSQLATALR